VGRLLPPSSRYQAITSHNLSRRAEWQHIGPELREAIEVVSQVLPFRTNDYVMRELIDWSDLPSDPIYQLTFPQPGMLASADYQRVRQLLREQAPRAVLEKAVQAIRHRLNPHPSGQVAYNVPSLQGRKLTGLQHKYPETVLFFPVQGQTCHAYCTFCFRWAQFVHAGEPKFQDNDVEDLLGYLDEHREVTDLLLTGGDPLVMSAAVLARYVEPLLGDELERLQSIRIGTKALAYWPQRFVSDPDADQLLRLFEKVVAAGRHLAVMAHYNHPVEMSTAIAEEAVRRVRATGAEIRLQSPVVRHINDSPEVWAEIWQKSVRLGIIPYYFFVERDTGPRQYFDIPLVRVYEIFREAYSRVSGLARTVRGPCMSAMPGKVRILGMSHVAGREVMVLDYLQARDRSWVRRPFFAKLDRQATWFDELEPAFESDRLFFGSAVELDPLASTDAMTEAI
jgi:KamA family protein